jgi:hypothetical protein
LVAGCPILVAQRQDGFPRPYFSNSAVSLPALSLLQFGSDRDLSA